MSIYLVISEEYANGRSSLDIAKEAIEAGVDILQMREKQKSPRELEDLGKKLSALCRESGVTFIVNDDPHLAKKVNADGVHLGQEDIKKFPVEKTRQILGREKIIGVSTHFLEEFNRANAGDCNYIAFGPVFETKTKDYFIGTDDIEEVVRRARKPVIFIGGINLDNVDSVLNKGAENIGVIRAIVGAKDIKKSVGKFKEKIRNEAENKRKN